MTDLTDSNHNGSKGEHQKLRNDRQCRRERTAGCSERVIRDSNLARDSDQAVLHQHSRSRDRLRECRSHYLGMNVSYKGAEIGVDCIPKTGFAIRLSAR
jgi:hypothetical protein